MPSTASTRGRTRAPSPVHTDSSTTARTRSWMARATSGSVGGTATASASRAWKWSSTPRSMPSTLKT